MANAKYPPLVAVGHADEAVEVGDREEEDENSKEREDMSRGPATRRQCLEKECDTKD